MKFAVGYFRGSLGGQSPRAPGVDPKAVIAFARHAEACGFECFYVPEHAVLYRTASEDRVSLGQHPIDPTMSMPDPLTVLAFVAAATERIKLGTSILVLPCHHPVTLAKTLATIDVLSNGRMLLVIGMGYLQPSIEACGVDFKSRGRRADEQIDVMRALWAGGPEGVSYKGEFFSFDELISYPKPYQSGGVPIHIGGATKPAVRRAGLRGDGYFPTAALHYDGTPIKMLTRDEHAAQVTEIRRIATEAGRDPDAIEFTLAGSLAMTEDDVADYEARGIHRIMLGSAASDFQQVSDEMSRFSERFHLV